MRTLLSRPEIHVVQDDRLCRHGLRCRSRRGLPDSRSSQCQNQRQQRQESQRDQQPQPAGPGEGLVGRLLGGACVGIGCCRPVLGSGRRHFEVIDSAIVLNDMVPLGLVILRFPSPMLTALSTEISVPVGWPLSPTSKILSPSIRQCLPFFLGLADEVPLDDCGVGVGEACATRTPVKFLRIFGEGDGSSVGVGTTSIGSGSVDGSAI